MRLIFAGTPEFAKIALERLYESGHEIVLVLTQPDRPAGRGLQLQASSVKSFALEKSLPLLQVNSLKLDGKYPDQAKQAQEMISRVKADLMVVAAYGLMLPRWTLEASPLGCINIHASLLPQWRGAAPIHRAIMAGDSQSGICIMQMDEGLDTGDLLLCESLSIDPLETTGSLHDRLAKLGADLITKALEQLSLLKAIPQNPLGATYAHKISKEESRLDWNHSSHLLQRQILGLNPAPGAFTMLNQETYKVWHAHVTSTPSNYLASSCQYGHILGVSHDGIDVHCCDGVLRITQLQKAGHKKMPLSELLKGHVIQVGNCFS
ncbi:MAG: methionyl-tRNA formyltransferase [Betaproteobacteria bacterium]